MRDFVFLFDEFYACSDGEEKFVSDFAKAWGNVVNLNCFDLL